MGITNGSRKKNEKHRIRTPETHFKKEGISTIRKTFDFFFELVQMSLLSKSIPFPLYWYELLQMKHLKGYFLLLLFLSQSLLTYAQNKDHEVWKIQRTDEILAEDGWINLVGLFWIDQENAFLNQIEKDSLVISNQPSGNTIGTFQIENDSVRFSFNPKLIRQNKDLSPGETLQFPVEAYGKGGIYYDRWKWTIINRGGQFAMRLRDLEHPGLSEFPPIPYFDYNSTLAIQATFIPKFNETINIPNVLGQVIEWKVLGILKFEIAGEKYELTTVDEAGKLFVIFSDLTNETETYPTGRYLYVSYPDRNGITRIDFNFAYNPPCAFTEFATCPIPPKVNRLAIAVRAGEKKPLGHE